MSPIGSLCPGRPDLVKVMHASEKWREIRLVGGTRVLFVDGSNVLMQRGPNGMATPTAQAHLDDLRRKLEAGERYMTVRYGAGYELVSEILRRYRLQFELPPLPQSGWDRFRLMIGAVRPHDPYPCIRPPARGLARLLRWLGQKELPARMPRLLPGAAEKIVEFEARLRAGLVRDLPPREFEFETKLNR